MRFLRKRFSLRTLLLFIAVIAVTIVVAQLSLRAIRRLDPFDGQDFVPSEWHAQAGSYDEDNPRAQMVGDLKRNQLQLKMTKSAVQKLLGAPDITTQSNEWEYLLGMWSGFRIDHDTLTISFDHNDEVAAIQVIQH